MAWAYTLSLAGVVFALLGAVASPAVHSASCARRNLGRPTTPASSRLGRIRLFQFHSDRHLVRVLSRFDRPGGREEAGVVDLAGIEPASEHHPRRFIQP